MELERYLADLESRIDPSVEDDLLDQWRTFCAGRCASDVFIPRRKKAARPPIAWPKISVNDTQRDHDSMILSQFAGVSGTIGGESGRTLAVRSNYGVPILAMPFGCELFMMSEESQTLPNCHPIGPEKARAWLDRGMPSIDHPYLQNVWEIGRRYMEIKRTYPRIAKCVAIYHPDFQGPMDVLELMWGSEIFLALVDEPQLIHRMLEMITGFYAACMQRWLSIVPNFDPQLSYHWSIAQPGQIMLRDDSAMNLPPRMFEEFILPYDQRLLSQFGGGCIHACGRLDHWTHFLANMKGAYALQMSQPHLNDLDKVLRDTVDQGILLLDLNPAAVSELQKSGRKLHGKAQMFP